MRYLTSTNRAGRPHRFAARLTAILAIAALAATGCQVAEADEQPIAADCSIDQPSIARLWNERALDAIRRDVPDPTAAARNLFHLSAAMWDTYTLSGGEGSVVFATAVPATPLDEVEQQTAISVAAHTLLVNRYGTGSTTDRSARLRFERALGLSCMTTPDLWDYDSEPVRLGLAVTNAVLAAGDADGADRAVTYSSVNEPLSVATSGTSMDDPQRWQPLAIVGRTTQTGVPQPSTQEILGAEWGHVTGFAIANYSDIADRLPAPPAYGTQEFQEAIIEVLDASRRLYLADAPTIDTGPGSIGANPLGTQDGQGLATNPVTGQPYERNEMSEADYGRVSADYWADGPGSETPPGHWNVLANRTSDDIAAGDPLAGDGTLVPIENRLLWDLSLYLVMNGALHDAAVAAWGAKAQYDYARPISMIRHAGGLGQASDPAAPNYHPDGLLLEPGISELITAESSAPGGRHQDLADHVGEVAVFGWKSDGGPAQGSIAWVLAVDWLPFQLPTFVSPAFPGYVSGHSTFSRAASEVLAAFTGTEYFPGGMHEFIVNAIDFAPDPESDVVLQWASYHDAADQAGRSRIWGGIHVTADDYAGRELGAAVADRAINRFLTEIVGG